VDHSPGHKNEHEFGHGSYGHKSSYDHEFGHQDKFGHDFKTDHGPGYPDKFGQGYKEHIHGHKASDHLHGHKHVDHRPGHKVSEHSPGYKHVDHRPGHKHPNHIHGHKHPNHIHGHEGYGSKNEFGHEDKFHNDHKGGYGHMSDKHGHKGSYSQHSYGYKSDAHNIGYGHQFDHRHKGGHSQDGYGHKSEHGHHDNGHGSKFDHGYKGSTVVEFLILDSHGEYLSGASVYYTDHNVLNVVKTDKYGTASVKIHGPVTSVVVFAAHQESKFKKIPLYGRLIKEKIALHKPANFRLLLQDPKTCKPLDNVLLKYKSGSISDTVDTGKNTQAHITVHGKKGVKAVTKKPYYEAGYFESQVNPQLSPFASFSIPPKFNYGEFLRVILNYNPRKCLHINLNLHPVRGHKQTKLSECKETVAPASIMETFTSKKNFKIVVAVEIKTTDRNCISDSQARVTLYNSQGQTKSFSSVGMDPLPEFGEEGLKWIVGCLFGQDLHRFIAINKFVPHDTPVNENICHY